MRIGIISDTHGSFSAFQRALEVLGPCLGIIHLGDVLAHGPRNDIPEGYNPKAFAEYLAGREEFLYIKGNCDAEVDEMVTGKDISKEERILEFDDIRVYCTHGHTKTVEDMVKTAEKYAAPLALYGHTHVKGMERWGSVLVVNPGSTTIPKDDGPSVAVFDTEEKTVKLLSLEDGAILAESKLLEGRS
ncbi:MAG: phosphodiesterase [Tissierellia bacterium]|nr:phosphodiesterase [Tissierellia bacterium]